MQVFTWELPGHAGMAPARHAFDVVDIADGVAESLQRESVSKVVAAGVSVGGAVSLELGLRHPELVSGVVMVSSALKFGDTQSGVTVPLLLV